MHASEQGRPDVKAARERWQLGQEKMAPERLIFIDESSAKTNMTRLRGRAPRGQRVMDDAPHGHWSTTTMIGSLRGDGLTTSMTIEGATTGDVFTAYVKDILQPTLRPGDLVIMDNLSSHKNVRAKAMIEAAGAQICFLPPYSPDFNPIEKMWSKIKALLRKAKARTKDTLFTAIGQAQSRVTAQDAQGWFVSCGYSFI